EGHGDLDGSAGDSESVLARQVEDGALAGLPERVERLAERQRGGVGEGRVGKHIWSPWYARRARQEALDLLVAGQGEDQLAAQPAARRLLGASSAQGHAVWRGGRDDGHAAQRDFPAAVRKRGGRDAALRYR